VNATPILAWHENARFGGLSGVIYGVFAYSWMKGRYEPRLGLSVDPGTVTLMLAWFVLCLSGATHPSVANGAHTGGLLAGLVLGRMPTRWFSFR